MKLTELLPVTMSRAVALPLSSASLIYLCVSPELAQLMGAMQIALSLAISGPRRGDTRRW